MTRRLLIVAVGAIFITIIGMALAQGPAAHAANSVAPKPTATATTSGGTNQPAGGNPGPIVGVGGTHAVPPTGGAAGQSGLDPLPFGIAGLLLLGLGISLRRRFATRE